VKVGTINFHSTGHHLAHYQSLRGTSKVEAVHSVLDRTGPSTHSVGLALKSSMRGWAGGFWDTIVVVCALWGRRFHQTACHQRYIILLTYIYFRKIYSMLFFKLNL
jgi:hypothetical protein